jgi:hypothetical protein
MRLDDENVTAVLFIVLCIIMFVVAVVGVFYHVAGAEHCMNLSYLPC